MNIEFISRLLEIYKLENFKGLKYKRTKKIYDELLKKYSPVNYVDKNTVPTVFGHGDRDDIVPWRNALALDKKLTECGVEHSFVPFPGSGHPCENKESMKKLMELFFDYVDRYIVR